MPTYQCLFIDLNDAVGRAEAMECRDDGAAQARADELLARSGFDAVEIWHAGRRTARGQGRDVRDG
jgi:hypothetical protein